VITPLTESDWRAVFGVGQQLGVDFLHRLFGVFSPPPTHLTWPYFRRHGGNGLAAGTVRGNRRKALGGFLQNAALDPYFIAAI
jgi:hypothetical protein